MATTTWEAAEARGAERSTSALEPSLAQARCGLTVRRAPIRRAREMTPPGEAEQEGASACARRIRFAAAPSLRSAAPAETPPTSAPLVQRNTGREAEAAAAASSCRGPTLRPILAIAPPTSPMVWRERQSRVVPVLGFITGPRGRLA